MDFFFPFGIENDNGQMGMGMGMGMYTTYVM